MSRNCGECLMNHVEVVQLKDNGVCPKCGTDYGPESKVETCCVKDCGKPSTGLAMGPPNSRKPTCDWHAPKNGAHKAYKPVASLVEKFYVNIRGHHWELECPVCRQRWTLERKDDVHPGNILQLLNHAASHKA